MFESEEGRGRDHRTNVKGEVQDFRQLAFHTPPTSPQKVSVQSSLRSGLKALHSRLWKKDESC
jgi:hypothetical protein